MRVLTLGTFHFAFPNRDVVKKEGIDVLEPQYQREIQQLVNRLAAFRPTHIVVEHPAEQQASYDSLYHAYLAGRHTLDRSEDQQIGFRLAARLGLKRLHCVDTWGRAYPDTEELLNGDGPEKEKFLRYFYHHPDTALSPYRHQKPLYKTLGITAELRRLNSPDYQKRDLGGYLIGIFKYETEDNPYFGPDFVTGWWFNRNLRIFRNIQRIGAKPGDRILVIYGSGHMNLLRLFFEASPEYQWEDVRQYLE
ncbi:MAG: hypothetical protein GXO27_07550 [Chlorobi bacterium]|nr:hypothetical protein [Chlorobiota bacterium]